MNAQWVNSSTGLPHEGQPVEFVLDGRDVALDGTYARQAFQSRWSDYAVERVRSWRSADQDERCRHEQLLSYRISQVDTG